MEDYLEQLGHISYSAISQYLKCPRCFYNERILKRRIEPLTIDTIKPLLFGNFYHMGLESHYGHGKKFLYTSGDSFLDGLLWARNHVNEQVPARLVKDADKYLVEKIPVAQDMFKRYLKKIVIDYEPESVEELIEMPLEDPITGLKTIVPCKAKLDLIAKPRDIVDHKTASKIPMSVSDTHKLQGDIYCMLYRQKRGYQPDNCFFSYHGKVSGWKRLDIPVSEDSQHKTFELIQDVISKIQSGDFAASNLCTVDHYAKEMDTEREEGFRELQWDEDAGFW